MLRKIKVKPKIGFQKYRKIVHKPKPIQSPKPIHPIGKPKPAPVYSMDWLSDFNNPNVTLKKTFKK